MQKFRNQYKHHEVLADIGEIAGHIIRVLDDEESAFKHRKKLAGLIKNLVKKIIEYTDDVFNKSVGKNING